MRQANDDTGAAPAAEAAPVTIRVCTSCAAPDSEDAPTAGERLFRSLLEARATAPEAFRAIAIEPVDCFAVCERPVTLAFQAAGKWSYVVGDVAPDIAVEEVRRAARAVADSPHGVPKLNRRPAFFRSGVVCRLPPAPVSAPGGQQEPRP